MIRRAGASDAGAIARILYQSFAEFETEYSPAAFAATVSSAEGIRRRLREGPIWVALKNDLAVGTIAAVPRDGGTYIRGMGVVPEARACGLGRQLLEEVEKYALQNRSPRLYLSTTWFLTRAIRLYEDYGFARRAGGEADLFGTPLFTMMKELAWVARPNTDAHRAECK